MKNLSRLLCLLLCAVLVCGMLPPAAVSAEQPDGGLDDGWHYEKNETPEETPAEELLAVEQTERSDTVEAVTQYSDNSYQIENMADLKEVLAIPNSSTNIWLCLNYTGTEPFVIDEDITIDGLHMLSAFRAPLVIAEGVTVTLAERGGISAKELQIKGTLINQGHLDVRDKLTVEGVLETRNFYIEPQTQIEGMDKIRFENEWNRISIHVWADDVAQLQELIKAVTPRLGGHIEALIELWSSEQPEEVVFTEDLTISNDLRFGNSGNKTFVVGSGSTLTVAEPTSSYGGSFNMDTLVVRGTLIGPQSGILSFSELYVDGKVEAKGGMFVDEKLIINGEVSAEFVSVQEEIELQGADKIRFTSDWGHLNYLIHAYNVEEFYQKLEVGASKLAERVCASVMLRPEEDVVFTKSFSLPKGLKVELYNSRTYTIDSGVSVNLGEEFSMNTSKLIVKGELVIDKESHFSLSDGAKLEVAGGKISGKGDIHMYTKDPASCLIGLDMTKYELIQEYQNNWTLKCIEGLTKLAAPSFSKWGIRYEKKWNVAKGEYELKEHAVPTSLAFSGVDGADYIAVVIYYEGPGGVEEIARSHFVLGIGERSYMDTFQSENRSSGTYYATVQAIGDYVSNRSSDIVTSEKFVYTNPGKKLETVTNVKVENDIITWDPHPQADQIQYYRIGILLASTADGQPQKTWYTLSATTNSAVVSGRVKSIVGEGYYTFYVEAIPKDASKVTFSNAAMSNTIKVELPETQRYAGKDRFDTSFKVADALLNYYGLEKFNTVIVASGANFADALAGSYLASWYGAPILLSYKDKQNNQVKEYIKENLAKGGTVFILGGESAVPKSMEKGLEAYKVVRLAGSNRFGTNLEILKQAGIYRNAPILVATGSNFADSLSASAVGAPILLVHKKLTNEQKDFLTKKADANKNPIYILGGESAVNATIEAEFKAMGFQVKRLAGKNRFDTSILIAEEFFDEPTSAVLAYAANYPDGLCGGALAYVMGAPLILTMDKQASVAAEYVKQAGIERAVSLGGEGLISNTAVNTILGK